MLLKKVVVELLKAICGKIKGSANFEGWRLVLAQEVSNVLKSGWGDPCRCSRGWEQVGRGG